MASSRKGFVHIVEIIIIFVVMFIVLYQFSLISSTGHDWSREKLAVQAYDIIFSLDKAGVDWTSQSSISSAISDAGLQGNIIYNLRVETADGKIIEPVQSIINNPVTVSIFKYSSVYGPMEVILNMGYRY